MPLQLKARKPVVFKGGNSENWPPRPAPKPTGCSDASDKESTEGAQGSSRRALSLESVGPCTHAGAHTQVYVESLWRFLRL